MYNQQGSALIESLIAMLILTVGVLGIASFEATFISLNSNANFRLEAALAGQELISMVNADKTNVACYVVPVSGQAGCNSTAASNYTTAWVSGLANKLPGTATYAPTATLSSTTFTVIVQWKKTNETNSHSFTTTTQVPQ